MSEPRIGGSGSSSSRGLPTPRARDWKRGGKDGLEEALMPTPRTSDTNGPGAHGSGGPDLRTAVTLLPTPTAQDSRGYNKTHKVSTSTRHSGTTLNDAVRELGDLTGPSSPGGSGSQDVLPLFPPSPDAPDSPA